MQFKYLCVYCITLHYTDYHIYVSYDVYYFLDLYGLNGFDPPPFKVGS